jgi:CheY-like chemotaxis protein
LVIEKSQTLAVQLAAAEERIGALGDQCVDAIQACHAAERTVEATRTEREELRRKCEELRQNVRELTEQRLQFGETERCLDAELTEARQQIAALTGERDQLRDELAAVRAETRADDGSTARLFEVEVKLAEMTAEASRLHTEHQKKLASQASEMASANRTRDLAVANVVKAQMQVQSLKSELEAQRKQANEDRMILEAQIVALQVQAGVAPPSVEPKAPGKLPPATTAPAPAEPSPASKGSAPGPIPFSPAESAAAAAALTAAFGRLSQTPEKAGLLEKLDAALQEFTERARETNLPAMHRASAAGLELTRWLRKTPGKVAATLPALAEILTLLSELADARTRAQEIADPAGATIYAVDDDIDNCECIAMAFEKLEFQTKYSVASKMALTQLKAAPADLVVLDVDLPQMDGFELYARLRKIPSHAETPVLFLSGLTSTQARLEELPPGNHAFLSKPYTLTVLGAKATAMILRSRLGAVMARG